MLIVFTGSTSAQALKTSAIGERSSAVDALEAMGQLEDQQGQTITSSLDPEYGLSVDGPSGSNATFTPVTSAVPTSEAGARLLEYSTSDGCQYALTGAGAFANAGYIIITGAEAPKDF
ncbi:hypothetical protein [Plantibacter sp. YIM 135249]|uniref:hypothetical protein n=1 Tax=Plantibacter sp. YIM 135249 TaxID=3423918 RepID=UPI003D3250D1